MTLLCIIIYIIIIIVVVIILTAVHMRAYRGDHKLYSLLQLASYHELRQK